LIDKKKFPAYASDRISALDDISVYTTDEDLPLKEVLGKLLDKESGKNCISHKEDPAKLRDSLLSIVPNLDMDRVYPSDIKKVFQWYNLLLDNELIKLEEVETIPAEDTSDDEAKGDQPKTKKPSAVKKTAIKATPKDKSVVKTSAPKKVAAVKTGSTRGK